MRRLLEIEYFKIRYHKASLRLLIGYFILIPMLILLSSVRLRFGEFSSSIGDLGVFEFPFIWHFGTYMGLYLKFILAIVMVSSVTGEYSNITLKQNLIDGLSKKDFLLSKVFMAVILALFSSLIFFFVLLFIGWYTTEILDWSLVFSELDYFLGYFIRLVGFLVFAIFSAILLKRSALALAFMGIWWLAEAVLALLARNIFTDLPVNIASYLPLASLSSIVAQPFQRIQLIKTASEQLGQFIEFNHGVYYLPMLQSVLWILVGVYLSYRILCVRDL